MLAIAADDLLNPVDVRRDPRHDVLLTVVPAETVDANKSPRAILISAYASGPPLSPCKHNGLIQSSTRQMTRSLSQ